LQHILNFSYKKKNINVKYFLFNTDLSFHIGKPYNLTSNAFVYDKNKDDKNRSNLKHIIKIIISAYDEIKRTNGFKLGEIIKKYKIDEMADINELTDEISNLLKAKYDL